MLSVSQQDVVVQGYGNLACARMVFKQASDFIRLSKLISNALRNYYIIESLSGSECRLFIFYGSS